MMKCGERGRGREAGGRGIATFAQSKESAVSSNGEKSEPVENIAASYRVSRHYYPLKPKAIPPENKQKRQKL